MTMLARKGLSKSELNSQVRSWIIWSSEFHKSQVSNSSYGVDLGQKLLALSLWRSAVSQTSWFVCSREDSRKLIGMKLYLSFNQMLQIQQDRLSLLVNPKQDGLVIISLSAPTSTIYPTIILTSPDPRAKIASIDLDKDSKLFSRTILSWDRIGKGQ